MTKKRFLKIVARIIPTIGKLCAGALIAIAAIRRAPLLLISAFIIAILYEVADVLLTEEEF